VSGVFSTASLPFSVAAAVAIVDAPASRAERLPVGRSAMTVCLADDVVHERRIRQRPVGEPKPTNLFLYASNVACWKRTSLPSFRSPLIGEQNRPMSDTMAQGMTDMAAAKNNGLDNAIQRTPENTTPTTFREWCEQVLKPAVNDQTPTISMRRH
jgi:hypothetical protein